MSTAEFRSAREIRSTMRANGSLDPKRVEEFRAACARSRAAHGDERHEHVKFCALHASLEKIDRAITA